jgi:hypothetical protein
MSVGSGPFGEKSLAKLSRRKKNGMGGITLPPHRAIPAAIGLGQDRHTVRLLGPIGCPPALRYPLNTPPYKRLETPVAWFNNRILNTERPKT